MKTTGNVPDFDNLSDLGLVNIDTAHWNLNPEMLSQKTIENKMGKTSSSGALSIQTGKFTGRSPKDRFIVRDKITNKTVWWGDINIPFEKDKFDALYSKVVNYLEKKEIYVRDVYACSLESFQLNIRSINEYPWSNHFVSNMFNEVKKEKIKNQVDKFKAEKADKSPDMTIIVSKSSKILKASLVFSMLFILLSKYILLPCFSCSTFTKFAMGKGIILPINWLEISIKLIDLFCWFREEAISKPMNPPPIIAMLFTSEATFLGMERSRISKGLFVWIRSVVIVGFCAPVATIKTSATWIEEVKSP